MQDIFNKVMTIISLLTATGVFMHDGRVDKAAMTAMASPLVAVEAGANSPASVASKFADFLRVDGHTHPDHNAAARSLMTAFAHQSPSIPPRGNEQKKHLLQECEPRGRHAFDNNNLPIIS